MHGANLIATRREYGPTKSPKGGKVWMDCESFIHGLGILVIE